MSKLNKYKELAGEICGALPPIIVALVSTFAIVALFADAYLNAGKGY